MKFGPDASWTLSALTPWVPVREYAYQRLKTTEMLKARRAPICICIPQAGSVKRSKGVVDTEHFW